MGRFTRWLRAPIGRPNFAVHRAFSSQLAAPTVVTCPRQGKLRSAWFFLKSLRNSFVPRLLKVRNRLVAHVRQRQKAVRRERAVPCIAVQLCATKRGGSPVNRRVFGGKSLEAVVLGNVRSGLLESLRRLAGEQLTSLQRTLLLHRAHLVMQGW